MPVENEQLIKDAYKHLEDVKALALALPSDTLVLARVSRERLLELMTALADRVGPALDLAAPKLSPTYLAELRALVPQLVPLALAFFAADLTTEAAFTDVQKARRAELAPKVRSYDAKLFPVLELLWGNDPVHAATVAAIRRGTGVHDDASDVLAGAKLAATDSARFALQKVITLEALEQWKRDATELLPLIDKAEAKHPGRDLHKRVFTLAVRAFDELTWVARFATRDLEAWPGLSARQATRPTTATAGTVAPTVATPPANA